jgi:isoprenylcysteine carboxyl methyltransferase (ICMT) family protein YpbQ
MYFMDTCFLVQVFFIVHTHASCACISSRFAFFVQMFLYDLYGRCKLSLEFVWNMKIAIEEDNGACVRLLFRQCIEWK